MTPRVRIGAVDNEDEMLISCHVGFTSAAGLAAMGFS